MSSAYDIEADAAHRDETPSRPIGSVSPVERGESPVVLTDQVDAGGRHSPTPRSLSPPAIASHMYRHQAEEYGRLHRRNVDGDQVDRGSHTPKPGFVSGQRGQSFLPAHLLSRDAQRRHEGERLDHVLGRMAHRYHSWHAELAASHTPANVRISAWDQAAFKFVFHDAFDSDLDPAEVQALAALVGSVVINLAVVSYNVFRPPDFQWYSTLVMARIVFTLEFVLVVAAFFVMCITIGHAFVKNKITTGFAVDVVHMSRFVGEFSVLQIVRLLSPMIVVTYVLPNITEARSTRDYIRGGFVVLLWAIGVGLSGLTLVLKVSQVNFAESQPFTAWTWTNFLVIAGLMLNLAKVDTSYDSVSNALLESVNRHYIGPGEIVVSKTDKSRSLFAKAMRLIGVEHDTVFTFFGTVFNYHFGDNDLTDANRTLRQRLRKALNFMSFVAKLDNRMLERYLEMSQSPMQHYEIGRRQFAEAQKSGDVSGMEMAVWLCDPLSDEVFLLQKKYPEAFRITFSCADD